MVRLVKCPKLGSGHDLTVQFMSSSSMSGSSLSAKSLHRVLWLPVSLYPSATPTSLKNKYILFLKKGKKVRFHISLSFQSLIGRQKTFIRLRSLNYDSICFEVPTDYPTFLSPGDNHCLLVCLTL